MRRKSVLAVLPAILIALIGILWAGPALSQAAAGCPCAKSINKLVQTYNADKNFKELLDKAFANMQQLPADYQKSNPWLGKNVSDLANFLERWCTFLPMIDGSHDDGLKYIEDFAWFYYQNPFGRVFVQASPGKEIMQQFVRERGAYMDSKASTAHVADWLADPRIEKEDYLLPDPNAKDGGFKSFNQFFARSLKDQAQSRPQTMPERDYIISAPTDCLMNSIPQVITSIDTPVSTKGREALNILQLLNGSTYAKKFVGGTALSCVLMPNTYHHFHSPVSGKVVEAQVVPGPFYGHPDFPNWAPLGGNVGAPGADFSPFEQFQRGYFIIDTGKYGHVAMVAVGLNTISSVVFNERFTNITKPVPVKRGDQLGNFLYGGSLFMMIFEPGRYASGAVKVRLGNQIGIFDTPAKK